MATKRKKKLEIISVDTNFWIYHLEGHPAYSPITQVALKNWLINNTSVIISPLTLTECLVLPLKKNSPSVVHAYHQLFNLPIVKIKDFTAQIATIAAQVRAKYDINTPDAIHLATAIHHQASFFISNDLRLKKVKEIPIVNFSSLSTSLRSSLQTQSNNPKQIPSLATKISQYNP